MRTAAPGPTVLPFATRSVRRFVDADVLPVVTALRVDHADALGTVPNSVAPALDALGDPIPGVYRVSVDTAAVALGARVDVTVRASVAGRVRDTPWEWVVGEGEFVDTQPSAPTNTLAGLDDDFADSSIDASWLVDLEGATFTEGAGFLDIFPGDGPGSGNSWYGNNEGPSMTKEVTGDFSMTADIVVTNDAGDDLYPVQNNRFFVGGLILIDPTGPDINTFDLSVGMIANAYSLRVQSTDDGFSTYWSSPGGLDQGGVANAVDVPAYEIVPGGGDTEISARLRVSRVGQVLQAEVSFDAGATWPLSQSVNRGQVAAYDSGLGVPVAMGATLRAGLQANSGFANPTDFRARFPTGVSFQSL
ncbi:MAG: hypothetical protein ACRBN8_19700 [Nannocystales bacterium]